MRTESEHQDILELANHVYRSGEDLCFYELVITGVWPSRMTGVLSTTCNWGQGKSLHVTHFMSSL